LLALAGAFLLILLGMALFSTFSLIAKRRDAGAAPACSPVRQG